ncbi:MAG: polyprenyl synthetase family protein [Myxococcales bacterium]
MDLAQQFVQTVDSRLGVALSGEKGGGVLAEASRALCLEAGGKRIRPRLTFLLGEAAGAPHAALEDVAAAGELIHGASLLHDDVVDEASVRRRRPTANARWGNAVAVLAGDWLLSNAFALLRAHPRPVTTGAIEVVGQMSNAAALELEVRGRLDLPLAQWRSIAEGKTGALFAWCGRSAAQLAGREDLQRAFDTFGLRLGVAFQLADDLKDLAGGEGKDRFADLKNKNPSVPILWAAQRSEPLRRRLEALWSQEHPSAGDVAAAGEALLTQGAAEETASQLLTEVDAALGALEVLGNPRWIRRARIAGALLRRWPGQGGRMKGLVIPDRSSTPPGKTDLSDWEALVVDAVGNVIEFWGFRANEGRVWALLYVRDRTFTAAEIGTSLGLSKGAVSMITREMEQWGVLHRVRLGADAWRFEAETDFLKMIGKVVEAREGRFIARVRSDLVRAEEAAQGRATREQLDRIVRMRRLADLVDKAVTVFLKTARFDVAGALGILTGSRGTTTPTTGGMSWSSREPSPATSKGASEPSTRRPRGSSGTSRKK